MKQKYFLKVSKSDKPLAIFLKKTQRACINKKKNERGYAETYTIDKSW